MNAKVYFFFYCLFSLLLLPPTLPCASATPALEKSVTALVRIQNNHTQNAYTQKAKYIEQSLSTLGLKVHRQNFQVPVREVNKSTITVAGDSFSLPPFIYNAITPQSFNDQAPLYYVGKGSLEDLQGIPVNGSIIALDFDSARNWHILASLGAKAIIYISRSKGNRFFFEEKEELTPLNLPCYYLPIEQAQNIFSSSFSSKGLLHKNVHIKSKISWQKSIKSNIYSIIEGSDPSLRKELLILEAPYDTKNFVFADSPGADSSLSIASFLELAKQFSQNPPKRSILLLATAGYDESLAGMREAIWALRIKSKVIKAEEKRLTKSISQKENIITQFEALTFPLKEDEQRDAIIRDALSLILSKEIDGISRKLSQLRLLDKTPENVQHIKELVQERLSYKRLSWLSRFHDLPSEQQQLFDDLIPKVKERYEAALVDMKTQLGLLKSAKSLRERGSEYDIAASLSLHLSSHGNGIGAFHRGWLYNLKDSVKRTGIYSKIGDVLRNSTFSSDLILYQDSLRPTLMRTWDSWFLDRPALGGEVSSMAGLIGLSLVTTGDSRPLWGTPADTINSIDWIYVAEQQELLHSLVKSVVMAPEISGRKRPRKGFSEVTGTTNLLLQGELFATYPAEGATILAYQGLSQYHAMVDSDGIFRIKGFADKKNVSDKLILEGYRFDHNGEAHWAIDKKGTGKKNYRLKILRQQMKTDLIMFTCKQSTIFNLLEPRNLGFMTKIQLYDGRRDAPPQRYWYSRIDTRKSSMCSIFVEPGTPYKATLSDTLITTKMILSNSDEENSGGTGFIIDDFPKIPATILTSAQDAWALLGPRIDNLENHGIFDPRINDLKLRGLQALADAQKAYSKLDYKDSWQNAETALALATRVYTAIDHTQQDVLFGVLFYIALFVPFAFVMERFLCNYSSIYKRIAAFFVILAVLIAIIYNIHPAFNLAYSPLIVILAFFIIALSALVSLIIFFRFEKEMFAFQNRAIHFKPQEIGRWKAFMAAFFLGVSNLRRRKLRTILTCTTLVILSFTIMSFTTIKSGKEHTRIAFSDKAAYSGLLLKKADWRSLPPQAMEILTTGMDDISPPAPRVWLEHALATKPVHIPLALAGKTIEAQGLLGLSVNEAQVTKVSDFLTNGRWFNKDDKLHIIVSDKIAQDLGVHPGSLQKITLWGIPFTVIGTFNSEQLNNSIDLDGEPLTPVIFSGNEEQGESDAEQEAIESGDIVREAGGRYQHVSAEQTVIIPANTLLAIGGSLKSIAVRPTNEHDDQRINELAKKLVDRFSLAVFTGDSKGSWIYNSSDTISYSGIPNIIIPLLISIFIVLNTMISSVYERKSEIAVYTSVGLAPTHVAFLFVAEALALAVISVVIGYLVAQISASLLAHTALWSGITVNYSSMAGVMAMLLVIAVVLISVIYPARQAVQIAIPDVNKSFKMPQEKDNTINIDLPFLVKEPEVPSIMSYLYLYFSAHKEISHGLFTTDDFGISKLTLPSEENYKLKSTLWLAPFDLGIMQEIAISPQKSTVMEGFYEISLSLTRKAGEAASWRRINTAFVNELRKQLLIWRSIDEKTHREHEEYFHSLHHEEEVV